MAIVGNSFQLVLKLTLSLGWLLPGTRLKILKWINLMKNTIQLIELLAADEGKNLQD